MDAATRRRNLRALKMSAADLKARAPSRSYAYYSDLLRDADKAFGEKVARGIEADLGLPTGWLDQDHERGSDPLPASIPTAGAKSKSITLLDEHTVNPIDWGELMTTIGNLGPVFTARLADNALAPELSAGTSVTFDRRLTPRPGDVVLIHAPDDTLHARIHTQGTTSTRWVARALHPDYADHVGEDVQCLAVMVARTIEGRRSG